MMLVTAYVLMATWLVSMGAASPILRVLLSFLEVLRDPLHLGMAKTKLSSFSESAFGVPIISTSTGAGLLIFSRGTGAAEAAKFRRVLKTLLVTPPRNSPIPKENAVGSFDALRKLALTQAIDE